MRRILLVLAALALGLLAVPSAMSENRYDPPIPAKPTTDTLRVEGAGTVVDLGTNIVTSGCPPDCTPAPTPPPPPPPSSPPPSSGDVNDPRLGSEESGTEVNYAGIYYQTSTAGTATCRPGNVWHNFKSLGGWYWWKMRARFTFCILGTVVTTSNYQVWSEQTTYPYQWKGGSVSVADNNTGDVKLIVRGNYVACAIAKYGCPISRWPFVRLGVRWSFPWMYPLGGGIG